MKPRTPLETGLVSFVDFKKDFIGKDALLKLKTEGVKQKPCGVLAPRQGNTASSGGSIFSENREIGVVTSGNQSPHHRNGIGLGYVVSRYAQAGQEIEIEVRDGRLPPRSWKFRSIERNKTLFISDASALLRLVFSPIR